MTICHNFATSRHLTTLILPLFLLLLLFWGGWLVGENNNAWPNSFPRMHFAKRRSPPHHQGHRWRFQHLQGLRCRPGCRQYPMLPAYHPALVVTFCRRDDWDSACPNLFFLVSSRNAAIYPPLSNRAQPLVSSFESISRV